VYSVFFTPLELALRLEHKWYDVVVEVIFYIDVGFSFVRPYVNAYGITVWSTRKVARHYLRGWFVPDLIAALPIYWFQSGDLINAFRLLRFVRLVTWSRSSLIGGSGGMNRLGRLLGLVVIVAHYAACMWCK
jgi:hypothetical protein